MNDEPDGKFLSLGAGVQSSALLMLSAEGVLPKIDAAIFADTGWEPDAVYTHLDWLEREIAKPAGIPIYRVSNGNLRDDALDPNQMRSVPAFTLGPNGERGKQNRKCTQQYKLRPILEQVRLLLGATVGEELPCRYCDGTGERIAPWREKRGETEVGPCSVCDGLGTISRVGQPPADAWAEQWIGFSTDEIERVSNRGDTCYSKSRYPLLELDMSRIQCEAYLAHRGCTTVTKSACNGCSFHGNRHWRDMRDNDPKSWADAVDFDRAYRIGAGMKHQRFLHISCLPLDQAPIDRIQRREHRADQPDIFDAVFEAELEDGDPDGCSPWACRSGSAVAA